MTQHPDVYQESWYGTEHREKSRRKVARVRESLHNDNSKTKQGDIKLLNTAHAMTPFQKAGKEADSTEVNLVLLCSV